MNQPPLNQMIPLRSAVVSKPPGTHAINKKQENDDSDEEVKKMSETTKNYFVF